jgi:hypothetical protein
VVNIETAKTKANFVYHVAQKKNRINRKALKGFVILALA